MTDRYRREVGALDPDNTLTVGVDYGSVVVFGYELTRIQAAELGRLLVLACWQAAQNEQRTDARSASRKDVIARLASEFGPHKTYDAQERAYVDSGTNEHGSTMVQFTAEDGYPAMRCLTYGEIADALTRKQDT